MIYVISGSLQNDIIQLLEESNSEIIYKFIGKQGIKLSFDVNTDDYDCAIEVAKKIIKRSALGKTLYFQITK
jgi:Uncharacterized conserved protein